MGFNTILYNADYPNSCHIHAILVHTLIGKPAPTFSQHIPTTQNIGITSQITESCIRTQNPSKQDF